MNQKTHSRYGFLQWCRRYISFSLIAVVGALVFILFFTDNSISSIYDYQQQIVDRRKAIKSEQDTLEYYRQQQRSLVSDPVMMEHVAREQYHMQRSTEDVYIY